MKKVIFLNIILIILFTIFSCKSLYNTGENSIRLLPEGYIGSVIILYDQLNGVAKEYENSKRIYRIPENGILRTQFNVNTGIQNVKTYYLDSTGKRKLIPEIILKKPKDIDPNQIVCFGDAIGSTAENKPNYLKYRSFIIGQFKDIDSLSTLHDKFVDKVVFKK